MKKKIQKLNKYSINIQSIRIDLVQPHDTQAHLGLGTWINSMAQGPNLRPAQNPSPNP